MNMLFLFLMGLAFAQSPVELEGLHSGRYELHPGAASLKKIRHVASEGKAQVTGTSTKAITTKAQEEKRDEAVSAPASDSTTSAVEAPRSAAAPVTEAPSVDKEEPGLGEQMSSLATGDVEKIYDFYLEQVHPDDIRNNRVEIEFNPGVVSNESKSNYSYRDYSGFFSDLTVKGNVWFTPMIGISGGYLFSFAADISGDRATHSRVRAHYEMFDGAIRFRHFFGLSRKARSVEFSLLYEDEKMKVPSDSTTRAGLKSSGPGVGVAIRLPTSASYAWVLGGRFFPRLQHEETTTDLNLHSGSDPESVKFGLDFGGEFKFSRQHQLIWSLDASVEKNLFQGAAGAVDPETGATPENVSVTNSMVMFSLGYRWGQ